MIQLQGVEQAVKDLYTSAKPGRDPWADQLYKKHVLPVARFAERVADKVGGDPAKCRAAALLHDIADTEMLRSDSKHEKRSLAIGREILRAHHYSEDDIAEIIDDACKLHSCHEGLTPHSLTGKVLATADALGHLQTDFYLWAAHRFGADRDYASYKKWAAEKIERDYHVKIKFDSIRQEARTEYQALKLLLNK